MRWLFGLWLLSVRGLGVIGYELGGKKPSGMNGLKEEKGENQERKNFLGPSNCFFAKPSRTRFYSAPSPQPHAPPSPRSPAIFQQSIREFSQMWFTFHLPDRQAHLSHLHSPGGEALKGKTTILPNKLPALHTCGQFWLKTSSSAIQLTGPNLEIKWKPWCLNFFIYKMG